MPDIKHVTDVLDMDIGMPVPLLKGVIDKKFDRNTGKSKFGKYSFENFYLADCHDEDERIKVTLKNCPTMEFEEGDTIIIAASDHGKGFSGCETDENEYKGKVETIVMVTESAEIMDAADWDGESEDKPKRKRSRESSRKPARRSRREEEEEDRPKRRSSERSSRRREYIPDEDEGTQKDGEEAFVARLFQAGNCYLRAYGMMHAVNQAAVGAQLPAMPAEQIQAGTYTLFAQAIQKKTLDAMPDGEITLPDIDDSPEEEQEEEGEESRPKRSSNRKARQKRTGKTSRSEEGEGGDDEGQYPED
jgi:hypothetical protein